MLDKVALAGNQIGPADVLIHVRPSRVVAVIVAVVIAEYIALGSIPTAAAAQNGQIEQAVTSQPTTTGSTDVDTTDESGRDRMSMLLAGGVALAVIGLVTTGSIVFRTPTYHPAAHTRARRAGQSTATADLSAAEVVDPARSPPKYEAA